MLLLIEASVSFGTGSIVGWMPRRPPWLLRRTSRLARWRCNNVAAVDLGEARVARLLLSDKGSCEAARVKCFV